jgi:hypothetical protein
MKRNLIVLVTALLIAISSIANPTNGFKYQAIVRNNQGAVLENSAVLLKVSILQGAENGASVYSEEHQVTTNSFGLINLVIGNGTNPAGNFNAINWSADSYFLKVEMAISPGTNFELLGISALLAVPYALHAETVTNNADADADPLNEIQVLDLTGATLSISQSNSVDFTPLITNISDNQTLSLTDDQLSITNGNQVDLVLYKDNTDEQTLSLEGDSLAITNGNKILLPKQDIVWDTSGTTIFYNQGNVGIGTGNPTGKLEVKGVATSNPDEIIFGVLNNAGDTVFAVYQGGVRINVQDNNIKAIGSRGGFAVGGISSSKATITNEYLRVTPDSVRIYVNNGAKGTGSRGGFAVGGISSGKTTGGKYMYLEPDNYFIGLESGMNINAGLYNSFLGYQTGYSTTDAENNVFLGYKSGYSNTLGNSNVFIGNTSGFTNTIGNFNVFVGDSAGFSSNAASYNVFIGKSSGKTNITGEKNTFLGYYAGFANTSGLNNVFIGNESGRTNTSGESNVFLGNYAGYTNNASNNVFLGNEAGRYNTLGTNNAFIGYYAGRANTTGASNVLIGNRTGESITASSKNVVIGNNSAFDVTASLSSSVIMGDNALTGMKAVIPVSSSLFIGKNAGINLGESSTSVSNCVFIGTNAGDGVKNTEWSTIESIVALGNSSGSNADGYRNVFIGQSAGAGFIGHQNTMIGFNVATQLSSGTYNVYLGDQCALNTIGSNNTFIGRTAGAWVRGDNNIFIGIDAGRAVFNAPRTESNRLRIGASNLIYGEFDNTRIAINATNPTQTLDVNGTARIRTIGSGAYSTNVNRMADGTLTTSTSDVRLKENINTLTNALDNVLKLRGVSFNWKKEPQMGLKIGFIAQEVEQVLPELVFTNEVDGFKGVNYAEITAVLTEAIKEQQKQIEALKEKNKEIDALKAELAEIKALLKK